MLDRRMLALARGCSNLVKVKVKKCRGVTSEGAEWLMASKGSLAVYLDAIVPELPDVSIDGQELSGVDILAIGVQPRM